MPAQPPTVPSPLSLSPDPSTDFGALADAGWPALERVDVGGWVARFADGVTQRANSVYPTGPVDDVDAAIVEVERMYRMRGLTPLFQLADENSVLLETLQARGYIAHSETVVLAAERAVVATALAGRDTFSSIAATTATVGARTEEASADVAAAPDGEWLDVWWAVDGRGGAAERAVARSILTGAGALYATVRDELGAASVGRLALVEQGGTRWGGLYALATRADARGHGHAHSAISALVDAGAERGVNRLWLQVLASNENARRLYDRLGFRQVATYRYAAAKS